MKRIIFGLDVDEHGWKEILLSGLIEKIIPYVAFFKIGSQLSMAVGTPHAVETIFAYGGKVFLDLKFHDTPKTVAAAVKEAARLGVHVLTVHADSGPTVLKAAVEAVRYAIYPPMILGVGVLTSTTLQDMKDAGIDSLSVREQAVRLAKLAYECGCRGTTSSAQEATAIRDHIKDKDFKIVVPAVRPEWAEWALLEDQARPATHIEAIRAGADYIVLSRAILKAPDPVETIRRMTEEITYI